MRIAAFINGDLRKIAEEEAAAIQKAGRTAVTAGGTKAQTVLRGQVQAAGLGSGVANAWRMTLYPKGSRRADNPAAYVASRAPRIVAAFDAGMTITARGADWMVIPLQGAIDLGLDRMQGRPGGSGRGRAKWSNVQAAIARFGDLRFVPIQGGGRALLVVDARVGKTAKGDRFYRQKPNSRRVATVVLFLLVRKVTEKKLLDVDAGAKAGFSEMYSTYVSELAREG